MSCRRFDTSIFRRKRADRDHGRRRAGACARVSRAGPYPLMAFAKSEASAIHFASDHSPAWLSRNGTTLAILVAGALVLPCVWQPHIEAGDLASHVYNAWLASLIAHGQIQGLRLAHPFTNVLGDWILSAGFRAFGAAWAARIVCVIAVEAFFWGAFQFVSAVNGKAAWLMASCLAMLAYGLIFYTGFVNFYLATACGVWMLAVLWRFSLRRLLVAGVIGMIGVVAHPLPIAWAACAIGYVYLCRGIPIRRRPMLLGAGAVALGVVHWVLGKLWLCDWSFGQVAGPGAAGITGVGQFVPFGTKYLLVGAGLLILWFRLLLGRLDRGPIWTDPVAHLWLLNMVALVALPSAIQFAAGGQAFQFIPARVSFFMLILFFALVGGAAYGRGFTRGFSALAAVSFVFQYADSRALNRADAEISALVAGLPAGQRVVCSITDTGAQVNGLAHVSDWACVGRCFDYGDYEPASLNFRIRTTGPNKVVSPESRSLLAIERGSYIVSTEAAPLYCVCASEVPGPRFELHRLQAGEKVCHLRLPITPELYR